MSTSTIIRNPQNGSKVTYCHYSGLQGIGYLKIGSDFCGIRMVDQPKQPILPIKEFIWSLGG